MERKVGRGTHILAPNSQHSGICPQVRCLSHKHHHLCRKMGNGLFPLTTPEEERKVSYIALLIISSVSMETLAS